MWRALTVTVVVLLALGGCGGGDEASIDIPDDVVGDLNQCSDWVTSGDVMTGDQVAACAEVNITMTVGCGEGRELRVISIDGQDWALVEGEPARRADEAEDDEFCTTGVGDQTEGTTTTRPATGEGLEGGGDPLSVGEQASVAGYEVVVTEVDTDADLGGGAGIGTAFVLTSVSTTYVGDGDGSPSFDLVVVVQGGDGVLYDSFAANDTCLADPPRPQRDAPDLATGGTAVWDSCVVIPESAVEGALVIVRTNGGDESNDRAYWRP